MLYLQVLYRLMNLTLKILNDFIKMKQTIIKTSHIHMEE